MRRLRSLLFGIAVSLGALPALATTPPPEDPEALISVGNNLRRNGDDARAEGYFKRAYQVAHTPRSAAQLGLVELSLGRYKLADDHLSEALGSDDTWVRGHAKSLEDSRVLARKHLLGVTLVGVPRDARVTLANGTALALGDDGVIWVEPGTVSLNVEAVGHKAARTTVTGAAGEKRQVTLDMPVLGSPVAPPLVEEASEKPSEPTAPMVQAHVAMGSSPREPLKVAGIATGSVGVAAVIVGAILLVEGNAKVGRVNDASKPTDPADLNYGTFQKAGTGLLVGGGVAVAGGAVMYMLGSRASAPESGGVSLNVGSGFSGLTWRGRFQ